MDCRLPGSSVHGILQPRILEWIAVFSSRGSSQPKEQTRVSRIAGGFFTIWATSLHLATTALIKGTHHWRVISKPTLLHILSRKFQNKLPPFSIFYYLPDIYIYQNNSQISCGNGWLRYALLKKKCLLQTFRRKLLAWRRKGRSEKNREHPSSQDMELRLKYRVHFSFKTMMFFS